jgi:hypothetical protein
MLPSGKITNSPKPILINDVNYSKNIFTKWSIEKLAELGISPFREERFNSKWFRSAGTVDTMDEGGTMVRTHTLVPRHTIDAVKGEMDNQVRSRYIKLIQKATSYEDFYDAVGDSVNKKIWGDYCIDLKNDAKILRDIVDAAGTYEEIIGLKFSFTPAPGETEGPI